MHDFSWNVFAMTGDVDAYLLYKQSRQLSETEESSLDVPPLDNSAES
ncbi:YqzL family protein [Paenibacillus thiaminolyticus]|uniref:YqzL family protein n=1 Tax=Paenibacillus thiaminolyticus TaxID=49283 RepID=A0A3A3GPM2_PANTH|nr:YqzL family protein [Paenibacillus thiaminolyticus]MCY9533871.1 YqzL family protein [Paenibacillus thiaminolyticus]MCY9601834.1 YqzL family protein [Paenibacillus thiaminolyticus]MCY9607034.1 YqzL family protein [Paenibacillus thiaminolyticus]MCY9614278.1 YqzL family protein [Paenibacillus thiaminolyticus]MCY9619165.1 YqzL family protein [Paenibacillus thiaminolyticus]